MSKKYVYLPPGTAMRAEPMKLTERQQRKADRWLVKECEGRLRAHTITFLTEGVAQAIGMPDISSDYDALHTLCATVRIRCAALGIPIRKLVRDDEGLGSTINPAKPRVKRCTVCGKEFRTPAGNRKMCDKCRSAQRVRHMPLRECAVCGREYQPKVHNSKYCSVMCSKEGENIRRRAQRAAKAQQMNKD